MRALGRKEVLVMRAEAEWGSRPAPPPVAHHFPRALSLARSPGSWLAKQADRVPDTQSKDGGSFSLATPVPCHTCRPRAPGLDPCLSPSLASQDFPRPFMWACELPAPWPGRAKPSSWSQGPTLWLQRGRRDTNLTFRGRRGKSTSLSQDPWMRGHMGRGSRCRWS